MHSGHGWMMSNRVIAQAAAVAVAINAIGAAILFRKELAKLPTTTSDAAAVPLPLVVTHLAFLAGVVVFAHHPAIFMGLFLFFLGVASSNTGFHHDRTSASTPWTTLRGAFIAAP